MRALQYFAFVLQRRDIRVCVCDSNLIYRIKLINTTMKKEQDEKQEDEQELDHSEGLEYQRVQKRNQDRG